ncbi:hypothetical protein AAG570_004259 [Ranatra chinensis]|uniref:WD repeat and HMG-box DNA-binding protein 1 n=1 Tax=Ranatra chinensis TaxID=642074 RepID=A0ABD0Y3C6_9HEMI
MYSRYVITCGSEGDLRIWKGGADDVDQRDVCVGETATAVAQRGKNVYVGADGHCVQAYTWPAMETDGVMTRFTAPVTQIEVSPDGSLLAAASSDMEIHVVNMENMECKRLIGHKAPVLSIALDPKLEFLVSSSCDTTVQVWSLMTCTVVKKWDGVVAKSNSFELSESLCRPSFSPRAGTMIAVPTTTAGEVVIYERQSWNRLKTLTAPNETAVMSVVKFSPCGRLLCGGSTRGRVYIWDVTIERVVQSSEDKNSHAITALDWNLDSTTIALCNVAGQLANLIVQDSLSRSNSEAGSDLDGGETLGVPEFEDDDDDSENVISLEKIKASTLHQNGAGDFDEGSSDDGDEKSSVDEAYSRPHHTPLSELQQAFQPSSTPAHLLQRFMVWNSVGIVKQFNTEDSNEIEVEFHDTGVHHSFRINNLVGHSMAALSTSVLAMASPKSSDSPDRLVCILLKAWDGQKEWDCRLEEWDAAVGVAAGANWVALATSSSVVRIYSADGTQRDVVSVPGPLVTLAASDDRLAIVFHTGQGSNGDQFMSYCLFRIHEGTRLASCLVEGALPMGTLSGGGCTLRWLGFTDENSLAALDFDGVLRVLYGRLWRPVVSLDQQCKSRFDHYFVVGVSETDQNVRCILCKGAYYPPVVPKPIVTEIKWQMPLCEMSSEKGRLEEEMLRNLITLPRVEAMAAENEDKEPSKMAIEKTISITVMKLFALACRSGLDGRAVALCEGMHSVDVVRLAAKYAAKLGRQQLANKITSIAEAIVHRSSRFHNFKSSIGLKDLFLGGE